MRRRRGTAPRVRRREDPRSPLRWGLATLAVIALALAAIFDAIPRVGPAPYELQVLVRSDAHLTAGSPVRIAGVEVGRVTGLAPGPRASGLAVATMEIDEHGLPIHADATAKIRPRLLLEGNFFVDLTPGSPSARTLASGDTLPADAAAGPVQTDRVLSDLPSPVRTSLRGTLRGLGGALGESGPDGGGPAGEALGETLDDAPGALLGTAVVTRAMLGEQPRDLARGVEGTARTFAGLARDDRQLGELVENLARTAGAFGDRAPELRRTVAGLDDVLEAAGPSLDALDAALPPTRLLARDLRPGLAVLPATMGAARPWLTQLTRFVSDGELGGLAPDLRAAVGAAAVGAGALRSLTARLDATNACLLERMLPVSRSAVVDPPLTTGVPVWDETLQGLAGLASAAQGFDGNGAFLRGQTGGGTVPVKTTPLPSQGELFGNAVAAPLGTRPAWTGTIPPVRTDAACSSTPAIDLAAETGVGP